MLSSSTLGRFAAALLFVAASVHAKSDSCKALADAGLSKQLFYAQDLEFEAVLVSYYAQDITDIEPACILQPETAQQVSRAIKALREAGAEDVAVKSGGHSPYPNNNIHGGVTIDLSLLSSVDLATCSVGKPIVFLGPGARWGDVYEYLEGYGMSAAGAREGRVGVGGFLLGGGMSWYTARVGFSVDSIVAYEIVLADGTIAQVTKDDKPDLFRALKGGMNNFGIVTKFVMKAFPASEVFGGLSVHPIERKTDVAENFVNMVSRHNSAEGGFVTYSWAPGRPSTVAYITANVDGDENSPSFVDIPQLDPFVDARAKQSLSGLTRAIASTSGLYNIWYTLTFDNSLDMAKKVIETFEAVVEDLQSELDEDITIIFLMTSLGTPYASSENILGLDETLQKDSIIFQGEALLPTAKHWALVDARLKAANAEIEEYAQRTEQAMPWRYTNYANPADDPFAGYGAENLEFLRNVSTKYDPEGFFQTNVPGGFKLFD